MAVHDRGRAFGVEGDKVERRALFPGRVVGAVQAVVEEVRHELAAGARGVRPAHPGRRQGAAHGGDRKIVHLEKFLRRAVPVGRDVGLIPHLPIPGLDLGAAIARETMRDPLENELVPLRVILRRVGPAGVQLGLHVGLPIVLVGLGGRGEGLGHETDLDIGPHALGQVGVEDAVEDRPVIDRAARGVLGVGVGAAPLQCRGAVAGGEQVVRAKVNGLRLQFTELAEQFAAVLHGGVVGFVGAEVAPERAERPGRLGRIHRDRDGEGRGLP